MKGWGDGGTSKNKGRQGVEPVTAQKEEDNERYHKFPGRSNL